MNKTVTTLFALIGIFLCGAIVGGVVAVRYVNVTVQKRAADQQLGRQQWMRITNQLNPSTEQSDAIRALVTTYMETRQVSRKLETDAASKLDNGIRAILTPEQTIKYNKLRHRYNENEKLWQRWVREQRAQHGESPMVTPKAVDGKERKGSKSKGAKPKDAATPHAPSSAPAEN